MKILMMIDSCQSSVICLHQKQNLTYEKKILNCYSRKVEILAYSLVKTAKETVNCGIFKLTKIGPQCVQIKVRFPYRLQHKKIRQKFTF